MNLWQKITYSKKRPIGMIAILAIVVAVPLTVFISQKQQEIRQRAVLGSGQEKIYFADQNGLRLPNLQLTPGQITSVYLYLDITSPPYAESPINGFDVRINVTGPAGNVRVDSSSDIRTWLDQEVYNAFGGGIIRFSRVTSTGLSVPGSAVQLGSITFTAPSIGSGFFSVSTAYITGPGYSEGYYIDPVTSTNTLTYTVALPTNTPTPTHRPTSTPTRTPTPRPPTSTPRPTSTPVPTRTPTPIPTCNNNCNVDSNCQSSLSCQLISGIGGKCRNSQCPASTTCRCTSTPTVTPTRTPTPTLIGHWKLNDVSGNTALDSSGYNHPGTLINSPIIITGSSCLLSKCLSFNGSNSFVRIPGNVFDTSKAHTYSLWAKPTSMYGNMGLFGDWTGGTYKGTMIYDYSTSGRLCAYVSITSNPQKQTAICATPALNQWHHFALTYNGSGKMQYYVDGVLISSEVTIPDGGRVQDGGDFYIGTYNNCATCGFKGLINDVKVYNYARTASQVIADYNEHRVPTRTPTPTPRPTSTPTRTPTPIPAPVLGPCSYNSCNANGTYTGRLVWTGNPMYENNRKQWGFYAVFSDNDFSTFYFKWIATKISLNLTNIPAGFNPFSANWSLPPLILRSGVAYHAAIYNGRYSNTIECRKNCPTPTPTRRPTSTPVPTRTPTPIPTCNNNCNVDSNCQSSLSCSRLKDGTTKCRNYQCPASTTCRCVDVR